MALSRRGGSTTRRDRRLTLRTAAMAVVSAVIASLWVGVAALPASAAPFDPNVPMVWLSQGSPTQLQAAAQANGQVSFSDVGVPSDDVYNAIGYRLSDNYIYGITRPQGLNPLARQHMIVRVHSNGTTEQIGGIPEQPQGLIAGTFGEGALSERLLVTTVGNTTLYVVNVDNGTYTTMPLTGPETDTSDITAAYGFLWGVNQGGGSIVRINPANGAKDLYPVSGMLTDGDAYGAAWTYGNGNLAFSNNTSGRITQVSVANPGGTPTFGLVSVVPGPPSGNNDATSAPGDPADLEITKSAPAQVAAGATITWTIRVHNNGPGDSSGFVLDDVVPAGVTNVASTNPQCTVQGRRLACAGDALLFNRNANFTLTGTAPNQDATIVNTATVTGYELDPVSTNNQDDATTIVDLVDLVPHLAVTKTSSAGATVNAGDVVNYTVTVTNDGTAAYTAGAPAQLTDDLSNVLDDATWNNNAAVAFSAGSTSAAPGLSGTTLSWSGPLKVGESATITYGVTSNGATNQVLANSACVPNPGETPDCDTTTTNVLLPQIVDTKSVDPVSGTAVSTGQVLTYTLTFQNTGGAPGAVAKDDVLTDVLDDAALVPGITVSDPALTATVVGDRIQVAGTLAGGQTVTVKYQVTVNPETSRGDSRLSNFLLLPGGVPGGECVPGDPDCSDNPAANISDSKSVNPVSGTAVNPGQVLTYTLTFQNTGAASGPIAKDDVLTDVLDDATLNPGITVSDPSVSAILAGDRIQVVGTVAANHTVTVTYQVTVNPETTRGNNRLTNFLLLPGGVPGGECVPGNPDCSDNPAPQIVDSKSVNPVSGTTVVAGQVLTYTLTFQNLGTADGAVAKDDVLTDVLDDAALTSPPVASNAALTATVVGDRIQVAGTLVPNQTVTVIYQVTVNPETSRGDNRLSNFLVVPGGTPGGECVAGDPDCTDNPIPNIQDSKAVNPVSGTTVVAGQVLTYTLTFHNAGTGAGAVAKDDVLTDVVDDAALSPGITVSDPALTATLVGDRIQVAGTLVPNQTVTVIYQVTVNPETARGDNRLSNFLVVPGGTPGGECVAGDPDCTDNPIPNIQDSKGVNPVSGTTVVTGQVLTYTLTFHNAGTGAGAVAKDDVLTDVLDDATLTAAPTASDPALAVTQAGDRLQVTGNLAANQTVTVTYQVTVNAETTRGNNRLTNYLVLPGGGGGGGCAPGDPDCSDNPMPNVQDSKAVDPVSGTTVVTGQVLTYTLTFHNAGTGAGAVAKDDVLTDVLDDATLTTAPVVSDPALTATQAGDRIQVTGNLLPDQTVTVMYQVTVLPYAERGDHVLGNFLVLPGGTPGGTCVTGDPDCTGNTIPHLSVLKTSDATPTAKVGDTLTYVVTITNDGTGDYTAANPASASDDLTSVLDDATYNDDVTATATDGSTPVIDYAEPVLSWTGPLAVGDSITMTYTVTTTGGGDLIVTNGACVPNEGEDDTCAETTTGLADIHPSKTVDPASGSAITAGGTATYVITISNWGTGPGAFSYTDTLEKVLDDATLTTQPTGSDAAVTVSPIDEDQFDMTGLLDADESVTVTYTVTTKAWEAQGDHLLGNWVTETGVTPSSVCEPGDETCTFNPIQQLALTGTTGIIVIGGTALTLLVTGLVLLIARRRRAELHEV